MQEINLVITAVYYSVVLILFVGNITYADYYTNLSDSFRGGFWILFLIFNIIAFELSIITYFTDNFSDALSIHATTITVFSVGVAVIYLIAYLVKRTLQLRQYFGKKRNKI